MQIPETALEYWLGTDQAFHFTVYTDKSQRTARDIAGYTLNFMVKRNRGDADASALFTTTATVTGTFNSDPNANTQKAVATIADTDLPVSTTAGRAQWALKRTDAGSESLLAFGTIALLRPVQD